MSSSGSKTGGGNGSGGGGLSEIPAASRKIVQGLKEIVNCPELEIYAMLKECNMNPDIAVDRLLAQGTFHEVKSKRERRKEMKDTQESRSRGIGNGSNRGAKGGGSDRNVGRGHTQFSTNEHGKPAYKRPNGSVPPLVNSATTSESTPQTTGKSMNHVPQSHSNYVYEGQSLSCIDDVTSSSSQASSGFQPSWAGTQGHASLADIVRMGPHQSKVSSTPVMSIETSYLPHDAAAPNSSHYGFENHHISAPESLHDLNTQKSVSNTPDMINGPGIISSQDVFHDQWPVLEQSKAVSVSSGEQPKTASVSSGEVQVSEGHVAFETLNAEHNGPGPALSKHIIVNTVGEASHYENVSHKDMSSYHSYGHTFEHQEGVSSAIANFQQLSLGKNDTAVPHTEDNHAVVIPNHLQVSSVDCSYLSFGTFKSGSVASEAPFSAINESSIVHLDTGIPEYYGDKHVRSMSDAHRVAVDRSYGSLTSSQPELMKQVTHAHKETFPLSIPGYDIENRQQLGSALSYAHSQIRDLPTYPSTMHAYSNSTQSSLLEPTVQQPRDSGLSYSPFLAAHVMPSNYTNAASAVSSPSISLSEVLRSGATGHEVPQNPNMNTYSQPTLGHASNMMGYSYLPQNYTYLPPGFQQGSIHQSLAAVSDSSASKYSHPQYRTSSTLPQSASSLTGYGSYGSSTNIPHNSFPAPTGSSISYQDRLTSLYKNESSVSSIYGPGLRTTPNNLTSTYYDLQGQTQEQAGYRQGFQEQIQQNGAGGYRQTHPSLGFSNYLRSQSEPQQSSSDMAFTSIQAPTSNQIWQQSY